MKYLLIFLILTVFTNIYAQYIWPENMDLNSSKSEKTNRSKQNEINPTKITGINATLVDDSNSIELKWVPPIYKSNNKYVIARASLPITSLEIFLKSKKVAMIPPNLDSFTDKDVPDGVHFYAILSQQNIIARLAKLNLGENSLISSIVVLRQEIPIVTSLVGKSVEAGILLTWEDPKMGIGLSFDVYRSSQPIINSATLETAIKLGNLAPKSKAFFDKSPINGKNYYTVISRRGQLQSSRFSLLDNVLADPVEFSFENFKNKKNRINFDLHANKKNRHIIIHWKIPQVLTQTQNEKSNKQFKAIHLYRFSKKPSSIPDFSSGNLIAKIGLTETSYKDFLPRNGVYYYALFLDTEEGLFPQTLSKNNLIGPLSFKVGKNLKIRKFGIDFDLRANQKNNRIVLHWRIPQILTQNEKLNKKFKGINLYRFSKKPKSIDDFYLGSLIKKTTLAETFYEDFPRRNGVYYYALFLDTEEGLRPQTLNENNLIGPFPLRTLKASFKTTKRSKKKPRLKKSSKFSKLDTQIKETYGKKLYRKAISALSSFKNGKNINAAKARFYIGLSYYRLGETSKAIDYFTNPLVIKYYGERAKFWYRKSLEKL